eukprot:441922_1
MSNANQWIMLTDPQTGRMYYANLNTRETRWTPPPGFGVSNTQSFPQTNIMSENETKQWRTATDPSTGREYWYHRTTRQTQWNAPDCITTKKKYKPPRFPMKYVAVWEQTNVSSADHGYYFLSNDSHNKSTNINQMYLKPDLC